MSAPKTLYVIDAREPVWLSWCRDTYSFGVLALAAWFANTQMPPSGWINFAIAICWVAWMIGKTANLRVLMTPDEAREWLDENYPQETEQRREAEVVL